MIKQPMLAMTCDDISSIKYPVLCSMKLDGIRMIVKDGVCLSRTMKPIPSKVVQSKFGKAEYEGYDGELIYGLGTHEKVFSMSTSFCMSREVPEGLEADDIQFYVFDKWDEEGVFSHRLSKVVSDEENNVFKVPHYECSDDVSVNELECQYLNQGYEGLMIRDPNGAYKQGRSTLKQGWLLKVKRFLDDEAVVVDLVEKLYNNNEVTLDERGYSKRSSHKENKVPANTLGALTVYSSEFGEFDIGTGLDDNLRQLVWDNKSEYVGKLVKFKYFPIGIKDKPRLPVFLGFRDEMDV